MKRRLWLWTLLGLTVGLLFWWTIVLKIIVRIADRFGYAVPCPASLLAWMLDNPIRWRYTRPVIERVGIQPGEVVLELGAGTGAFTVTAAQHVGPQGRLVAVDIQPEMIAQVEKRLQSAGVTNVETHLADAYHLPMPDESADRAYLISVLEEVPDPIRALAELRRVLKPEGILSITAEFMDPDYWFPAETIRQLGAAGFTLVERFGNLWCYTLNFSKVEKHLESSGRGRRLVRNVQNGAHDEYPDHVEAVTPA